MVTQLPESDLVLVRNAHLVTSSESVDPGWLLVEKGNVRKVPFHIPRNLYYCRRLLES